MKDAAKHIHDLNTHFTAKLLKNVWRSDGGQKEGVGGRQNYYVSHFVFTAQNVFQYDEMHKIFPLHLTPEFISSVELINQRSPSVRSK
jgi:hypothetical protein